MSKVDLKKAYWQIVHSKRVPTTDHLSDALSWFHSIHPTVDGNDGFHCRFSVRDRAKSMRVEGIDTYIDDIFVHREPWEIHD